MKIGDKVRFLSDVGGGKISGFQGKNIVLVEDEDGFEIPTPITEVVLVGDENMTAAKIKTLEKEAKTAEEDGAKSIKARLSGDSEMEDDDWTNVEEPDYDPSDNFVAPVKEREGGDKLVAYLAFVPKSLKEIGNTAFASYMVNDSNYYVHYVYMVKDGEQWSLKSVGEIEPNTKLYIEEFSYGDLNSLQDASIQLVAYKYDKSFELKPALSVNIRLDATKFYKLNTFRENDFFETPALLYPVSEKDKVAEQKVETKLDLPKKLQGSTTESIDVSVSPARKPLVRRYADNQSKSHRTKQVLKNDKIIVDLHIDELLESTAGMSAGDILEYQINAFRNVLEQYKNKSGQKIVFIHGKGEGVLRHALIHELNYKYKKYQYQDASFQEYGYGATQVTIIA
ncbi:DUF2027 domain-containing protein [Prevotella sp. HUN102]|uniref:DUF2027 domain-containing protein n=1 Tax=Prevotella sp. HUN102 TaxID=1392486 RepID=UPI00048C8A39|nr:DUF2027 domain-containing protein [Prevotella sp. HUN102]